MSRRIGSRSTWAAAAGLSALALALSGVSAVSASAATTVPTAAKAGAAQGKKGDIREPSADMLKKQPTKKEIAALQAATAGSSRRAALVLGPRCRR